MRWTRTALLTKAHACGRRSRVVLTPRRWRQVGGGDSTGDGDNKARSPGRARRKPLKPLRREGRVFRWTCGDALACFLLFARGAAGAAGTRLSLRPLILGGWFSHNSGVSRRGNAEVCLAVIPGCAKRRPQMCRCTSGNLEIPGSMLRIAPE
jgi:hypothetical protein